MTFRPNLFILLLAMAALLTTSLDAVGAGWWKKTAKMAEFDPNGAAKHLAEDPQLQIPAAVQWSTGLAPRPLAAAQIDGVVGALDRISELQRQWFGTDPSGYQNCARAALLDRRMNGATECLEAAVVRDPTSPSLRRLTGLLLMSEGRLAQAMDHLAEGYALAPGLQTPTISLAPEDERWVRYEGLKRALDLYPRQRAETVLTLANLLREDGNEARGRLALEAELPHPEVELRLAEWDREAGLLDDARIRLEAVIGRRSYPERVRARAWAQLAQVRDLAGDSAGATAAAGRALALDPRSTAPHLALAALAERRLDYAGALKHLRGAWGLTPADPRLLMKISVMAEKAGEVSDARLALERAVVLQPDSPALAARLVDFYLRHGEFMEATLRLNEFTARFPTDSRLLGQAERLSRDVAGRR